MAFNVIFYTFSKKERSTAVPASGGKTVSCLANEPMDLLAPVISLDWRNESGIPTGYNYAYIASFSRYYWITGWTCRDGLWWAALRVDPLASWKTSIGAQQLYVYRAAAEQNNALPDTKFPLTAELNRHNTALPKLWTVGGANAAGTAADTGTYVLGIISSGISGLSGVQYYGFTASNLSQLMDFIFSSAYFNHILTDFGATEYPEAKVAINPLQYITSARFFPIGYSSQGSGNYLLHGGGSTFVAVGNQSISDDHTWAAAFFDVPNTQLHFRTTVLTETITITSAMHHPQAAVRGYWLDRPPYTRIELFYPPFGILELDPSVVLSASSLALQIAIDVWTGTATMTIQATISGATRTILRLSSQVGLDIPLSNIYTNARSEMQTAQGLIGMAQSAVNLDPAGVLNAERSIGQAFVNSLIPHLSTTGTMGGSTAPMAGTPALMITHQLMADDDNAGQGRPLCKVKTISACPGYVMADPDEVEISCTEEELSQIRSAIGGGFYYE